MLLNLLISVGQAITENGALSANYTLALVIGICGFLIVVLLGFVYQGLNSNIKSLSDNFALFQKDFNAFLVLQKELNGRFDERIKQLEKK